MAMSKPLTDAQALARLRRAVAPAIKARGLKAWAAAHDVDYNFLRDVLNERRTISPNVAKAIGLQRVVGWVVLHPTP